MGAGRVELLGECLHGRRLPRGVDVAERPGDLHHGGAQLVEVRAA
ncbi:hypothetical protein [Candidatus Frankia alpina]|nr:hypothetical protein [Candidatus Frankia alpina]